MENKNPIQSEPRNWVKKSRPIHPFPARMAPEIVKKTLMGFKAPMRVLDPMSGSGTTIYTARASGHKAFGFDSDPLAVLIGRAWCSDAKGSRLIQKGEAVLQDAKNMFSKTKESGAFPSGCGNVTKDYISYWFDAGNRHQLNSLAKAISKIKSQKYQELLWCAFSKMIITKKVGVSLAMDVSHSRPHRTYDVAPVRAFDLFPKTLKAVSESLLVPESGKKIPAAKIRRGDARKLPLENESIDIVITSPPYLNAIDYLRGHKLSLVWMGHAIEKLSALRSSNIGSEKSLVIKKTNQFYTNCMNQMCEQKERSSKLTGMLTRYLDDLDSVFSEITRVLKRNGRAIVVVGDCSIKENYVQNSTAIKLIGKRHGLKIISVRKRPLPENRRYLPPPSYSDAGKDLGRRMREEVLISFAK